MPFLHVICFFGFFSVIKSFSVSKFHRIQGKAKNFVIWASDSVANDNNFSSSSENASSVVTNVVNNEFDIKNDTIITNYIADSDEIDHSDETDKEEEELLRYKMRSRILESELEAHRGARTPKTRIWAALVRNH